VTGTGDRIDDARVDARLQESLARVEAGVRREGVGVQVRQRVARRRRRRTAASVGTAAVLVLLVGGLGLLELGPATDLRTTAEPMDGADPTDIAGPSDTAAPATTPGTAPGSEAVVLPGEGARVTLVAADDTAAWFTRGQDAASARTAPDTVTAVSADGRPGPSTVVQGVPVVGAASPLRLWLLVDETPQGPRGTWRLKEIERADGRLLASRSVELPGRPDWLEVLDGRLLVGTPAGPQWLDPATGALGGPADRQRPASSPGAAAKLEIQGTSVRAS
jgi:hypothetical protein